MGGTFTTQNKILPDFYINYVSAARATSNLSERGVVAAPVILDWGADGEVFVMSGTDFLTNALKYIGYDASDPKAMPFRELFKNARLGYFYKVNGTGGAKATSDYGTAKYKGARGNSLRIVVTQNLDETTFDFELFMDNALVFEQFGVSAMSELQANDFVDWNTTGNIVLTSGKNFTGGVTGTAANNDYINFIDKVSPYSFNVLVVPTTDVTLKNIIVTATKRLRDEVGLKFQTVLYRMNTADYEGVISVENKLVGEAGDLTDSANLVWWVAGAAAGVAVNRSNTNKAYDGELAIDVNYSMSELETALTSGKFIFYRQNDTIRVVEDINTFRSFTQHKNEDFASNQTIRVLDQIANDIGVLFNTKYKGVMPNDNDGRVGLWADIAKHHQELQTLRAIQNFDSANIKVKQGESKKSVVVEDSVEVTNAMAICYMQIVIA